MADAYISFFGNKWYHDATLIIIYVLANFSILSNTLLFLFFFALFPLWGRFGFCQKIQYDVIMT